MCKYFNFNEDSKIIGQCSIIEQAVLCCGDSTECECPDSKNNDDMEEIISDIHDANKIAKGFPTIQETNTTLNNLISEMRQDVAALKKMTQELIDLSKPDDLIPQIMEGVFDEEKEDKQI